jgi:hypothetical protein
MRIRIEGVIYTRGDNDTSMETNDTPVDDNDVNDVNVDDNDVNVDVTDIHGCPHELVTMSPNRGRRQPAATVSKKKMNPRSSDTISSLLRDAGRKVGACAAPRRTWGAHLARIHAGLWSCPRSY